MMHLLVSSNTIIAILLLDIIILATANANDPAGKDQTIIIGMAVLSVLTTTILTIIILISWRKITLLKRQMIE